AANGSLNYDPNHKFDSLRQGQTTTDSFSYTLADSGGLTSSAGVTITIQGVNDSPTAANDTASTSEDQILIVSSTSGVLANDTDADSGDTKSVIAVNGQTASVGQ